MAPVDVVLFPEAFLYDGGNAEVVGSGPIIRAMRSDSKVCSSLGSIGSIAIAKRN